MGFEWDEDKRTANLAKHGIDFVLAAKIFRNPTIERIDDRDDYGEERIIAVGQWSDHVLVVIYTWRDDNRRLISALKAGRNDKEKYHDSIRR